MVEKCEKRESSSANPNPIKLNSIYFGMDIPCFHLLWMKVSEENGEA